MEQEYSTLDWKFIIPTSEFNKLDIIYQELPIQRSKTILDDPNFIRRERELRVKSIRGALDYLLIKKPRLFSYSVNSWYMDKVKIGVKKSYIFD